MNLLERVLTLLRANLNTMAEKSEDPEKMLRQLQLDMRNQLVQVKTQVATAIAEMLKLQQRTNERQAEANSWHKKAEQAIQQNNENAARTFLGHYNNVNRQMQRYQQQQKEQEQLATTLRSILRQLETKISEVDTTIELLAARKRAALLQQRVYDALSKSGSPKERERAERAQDALLDIEARARALAKLQQLDLGAQLEQISQEQLIDEQLQQLKGQKQVLPLPPAGDSQPAELVPPVPIQSEPVREHPVSQTPSDKFAPIALSGDGQHLDLDLEKLKRLMDK